MIDVFNHSVSTFKYLKDSDPLYRLDQFDGYALLTPVNLYMPINQLLKLLYLVLHSPKLMGLLQFNNCVKEMLKANYKLLTESTVEKYS
jgi:hypothetical protein